MLRVILALVLLWVIIGVIGAVAHGLFWLTILAAIALLVTLVFGGRNLGQRPPR